MHILVIRASSMGDVVLTVPVLRMVLRENPTLHITLVTKSVFKPFFHGIERLELIVLDTKRRHKSIWGLSRLANQLSRHQDYSVVIDLHAVIRSFILSKLLNLKGIPVFRIRKGRAEKARLLKRIKFKRLKHTTERYMDVFRAAGLQVGSIQEEHIQVSEPAFQGLDDFLTKAKLAKNKTWIGIAPFAKHAAKMWPNNHLYKLIEIINDFHDVNFFMFGGGEKEHIIINSFTKTFDNVVNMVGMVSLPEEIALIKKLDFMISMDSANMHLASLLGTKVISIWGATHPYFGFSPVGQRSEFSIQIPLPDLKCRPCSVYGKAKCTNPSKYKCLYDISPDHVYTRLVEYGLLTNEHFNENL